MKQLLIVTLLGTLGAARRAAQAAGNARRSR
jgi:hypothetical protein